MTGPPESKKHQKVVLAFCSSICWYYLRPWVCFFGLHFQSFTKKKQQALSGGGVAELLKARRPRTKNNNNSNVIKGAPSWCRYVSKEKKNVGSKLAKNSVGQKKSFPG